ncbi:hypothetical protein EV182_008232, partial [Spiromyces aspiralis]
GRRTFQETVFVGVESERGFNVRAKIIGTGGENMKFIQYATGVHVKVRGGPPPHHDGGFAPESSEPMSLFISGNNEEAVKKAKEYCEDLVTTVREDYEEFKRLPPPPPRPSHSHHRRDHGP